MVTASIPASLESNCPALPQYRSTVRGTDRRCTKCLSSGASDFFLASNRSRSISTSDARCKVGTVSSSLKKAQSEQPRSATCRMMTIYMSFVILKSRNEIRNMKMYFEIFYSKLYSQHVTLNCLIPNCILWEQFDLDIDGIHTQVDGHTDQHRHTDRVGVLVRLPYIEYSKI